MIVAAVFITVATLGQLLGYWFAGSPDWMWRFSCWPAHDAILGAFWYAVMARPV